MTLTEPVPKLVTYALDFYNALYEKSTKEQLEGSKKTTHIFKGKLTEVWDSLKISGTYYTPIRRYLLDNDCIRYIERGARNTDTILILVKAPPTDVKPEKIPSKGLTGTPTAAKLDHRLEKLEAWIDSLGGINITEALRNMEARLQKLESKNGSQERVDG